MIRVCGLTARNRSGGSPFPAFIALLLYSVETSINDDENGYIGIPVNVQSETSDHLVILVIIIRDFLLNYIQKFYTRLCFCSSWSFIFVFMFNV